MKPVALHALLLLLVLSLPACASSGADGDLEAYRLTVTQADGILLDSIREGFPEHEVRALGEGRVGYEFRIWNGGEMDVLRAEAVPLDSGRYDFRVTRSGTAEAAGEAARELLLVLIEERASRAAL